MFVEQLENKLNCQERSLITDVDVDEHGTFTFSKASGVHMTLSTVMKVLMKRKEARDKKNRKRLADEM